jgi:SAM-dependent methyltransferase
MPPTPDWTADVATPIDGLDTEALREAIREEYSEVARDPSRGFHFHTGRPLARLLAYEDEWLKSVPEPTIASFAGTGNPFSLGLPQRGAQVVDVGCGAGIDTLIAASMVGPEGRVVGVDMTPAMIERARVSVAAAGCSNVRLEVGVAEQLPVEDDWADLVISNGVLNLFPDKLAGLREMARVLKPSGRLQIGDILVSKPVSLAGKRNIDLWKA